MYRCDKVDRTEGDRDRNPSVEEKWMENKIQKSRTLRTDKSIKHVSPSYHVYYSNLSVGRSFHTFSGLGVLRHLYWKTYTLETFNLL